jgi:hypothetical protein
MMMHVLRDGRPVPESDPLAWGQWYGVIANRRVDETYVGPVRVSTVFLGLDHGHGPGPPLFFETMVFGKDDYEEEMDNLTRRYTTLDEARAGHREVVEQLKARERTP